MKLKLKVLGKEFEDDSPQCGEMSEGQRGQATVGRTLFQKGSSSIIVYNFYKVTTLMSGAFLYIMLHGGQLSMMSAASAAA